MSNPSTIAKDLIGDIAPKLAQLTDRVLFDDVWSRPELSRRERVALSPCWDAVGDMSAPVAANRICRIVPAWSAGRKWPHSRLALHPQPEPPAWVSWVSGS